MVGMWDGGGEQDSTADSPLPAALPAPLPVRRWHGKFDSSSFFCPFSSAPHSLMTIDSYAICPCGSGKKIKFCAKCKDTVGTLDEIAQMIEGGQIVPALDRLGSVLQQHPDAAWALAVRGRLLLDLREYDSLTENAERFIRLQPGNPLALTQRAAAHLYRGDVEPATELILEALTESGQTVDSFVLEVATVLAFSLAQQGVHLTARDVGDDGGGRDAGSNGGPSLQTTEFIPPHQPTFQIHPAAYRAARQRRMGRALRRGGDFIAEQ
jgi:hypothetical protein